MLQLWLGIVTGAVLASSIPTAHQYKARPPAFFLAGDSTTAYNGGWGDGFLAPLISTAWGVNIGKSGATTVSYVAGGNWLNITTHLRDNADKYDCYVTISVSEANAMGLVIKYFRTDTYISLRKFGHNDQKAENGVPFDIYQENLIKFAKEVQSLGGTPLLTSSLTRRVFPSGEDHNATDSLHNERLAAIAAAKATNSTVIDLNAASLKYVNAIGKAAAWEYNWGDDKKDTTHLNDYGTVVFGRIVADLVIREKPYLSSWFTPNETLSYAIWNGLPA
ncbi:SGNH hydrolase-type esterase domain-containing protein [Biscogniauxia marginata]|nr:SGNH hydrolase-type esterase domain-containing protein [Biscogniauxia marginata]